ncbi:uncharacterized protein P174DRAFT_437914, partial [Aspergillus novofumigatus IBT 16806]
MNYRLLVQSSLGLMLLLSILLPITSILISEEIPSSVRSDIRRKMAEKRPRAEQGSQPGFSLTTNPYVIKHSSWLFMTLSPYCTVPKDVVI